MSEKDPIFTERLGLTKGPKINDDCPTSMRIGIWHAISRCVDRGRIDSWVPVANELLRLAREQRVVSNAEAWDIARTTIHDLRWDLVFVLCERIFDVILQPEIDYDFNGNPSETVPLLQVRRDFEEDINQTLSEDNSAYRMRQGKIYRPGRAHSQQMAVKAGAVLQDANLKDARIHYQKAVRFFPTTKRAISKTVSKKRQRHWKQLAVRYFLN